MRCVQRWGAFHLLIAAGVEERVAATTPIVEMASDDVARLPIRPWAVDLMAGGNLW